MVPYSVRFSACPPAMKRSIVMPPVNPLPVKSNTAPPAKCSGGWLKAYVMLFGANRFCSICTHRNASVSGEWFT